MPAEDFDPVDALRVRALRAIWKPDYEAMLRRIFRWYSEKFHTPLHLVQDLPLDDVLLNWFEVNFEDLAPEERHNMALGLLETPEERRQREATDKHAEDDFVRMTQKMAVKQKADKKLKDRVAEVKAVLEKRSETRPLKESSLPAPKPDPIEEEVTVSFTDESFDLESDGMPVPPTRKKQQEQS